MSDALDSHYRTIVKALLDGRVIPLLGAGVNLYGRPPHASWQQGLYLPSGEELAAHLAKRFDYPSKDSENLARVSQYVSVMTGSGPLYDELHELFDADYRPTPLHRFLAGLPMVLRQQRSPSYQLIITTNYDDALERAFREAGEPFDLVYYIADGDDRGKFRHFAPERKTPVLIEKPNKYAALSLERRTVIAKIHGAVDRRKPPDWDSYVITEDHYIDYLARADISNLIPATLAAKLRRSHFLFLGYGMRDWNLRVILHRIWGQQQLSWNSWAVHRDHEQVDQEFWRKRGVDTITIDLQEYVNGLERQLREVLALETDP